MNQNGINKKWVCPLKQNPCIYEYNSCYNPKLYCRILEDIPEHYLKSQKKEMLLF